MSLPPDEDERETDAADLPTAPRVPRPRVKLKLEPGMVLDRYVIVGALGRGGMGAVMLAYDTVLSRRVAIKVLHTDSVSEDARSRMQREAQAMAQLSHPNVVAIYDVGAFQGNLYLALEYVEGDTLRTWLKEPRTWQEILEVMKGAARGLAVAHAAGIIHRDFKPSNVLVAKDGRVCVLDFGIASAVTHGDGGPHSKSLPPSSTRSGPHSSLTSPSSVPPSSPSNSTTSRRLDHREIVATLANAAAAAAAAKPKMASSPPTPSGAATPPGSASSPTGPSVPPTGPSGPTGGSSSSLFDEKLTQTGAIVGTPGYFAPETVLEHKADARSDIWSFSVSFWRALYGDPPFPTDLALYLNTLTNGAHRSRPKKSKAPAWLHRIVDRGLQVNPDDRFSSMEEVITELSRSRTKRRNRFIAGIAILAVVVLGLTTLSARRVQKEREVEGAISQGDSIMATSWNDDKRTHVRAALLATHAAGIDDASARTVKNLGDYAKAWTSTYREASEATLRAKTESERTLDARLACLDLQRAVLDALVTELSSADAALGTQAVAVTYQLGAPKRCLDPSVLRNSASAQKSPEAHAQEISWRRELARAEALDVVGKFDAAANVATRVLDEAVAANDRATQAIALKRLAEVADESDHGSDALDLYTRSAAAAEAAGDEALAVEMTAKVGVMIGDRLNKPKDALPWISLAKGMLERLNENEPLEWEVLKAELIVIGDNDRLEESLSRYPRLVALSERVFGADHPRTATVLSNYGYDLADSGRYDESIAVNERATAILEKAWGEKNPNLGLFFTNYAHFLARGGRTALAFKMYDHALSLNAPFGENRMTAEILGKKATLALRRRDYVLVEESTKRGIPVAEGVGKDADADLARLLVAQGFAALGSHDAKGATQAAALCARALPLLEPLDGAGNYRADVLRCLAEAAIANGDPQAAIAFMERDEHLPRHEWPGDLALGRFTLARALTAAHKDPTRAHDLAVSARDDLTKVPQLDLDLADVQAWLIANPLKP